MEGHRHWWYATKWETMQILTRRSDVCQQYVEGLLRESISYCSP